MRTMKQVMADLAKMTKLLDQCEQRPNRKLGSPCYLPPKSAKAVPRNRILIHNAFHGELPGNATVHMRCDRKRCVSPGHMSANIGYNERQIEEIREAARKGKKRAKVMEGLAEEYEADLVTILNIVEQKGAYENV